MCTCTYACVPSGCSDSISLCTVFLDERDFLLFPFLKITIPITTINRSTAVIAITVRIPITRISMLLSFSSFSLGNDSPVGDGRKLVVFSLLAADPIISELAPGLRDHGVIMLIYNYCTKVSNLKSISFTKVVCWCKSRKFFKKVIYIQSMRALVYSVVTLSVIVLRIPSSMLLSMVMLVVLEPENKLIYTS